jgi:formylmethanofuran dehydrogenase subunit B
MRTILAATLITAAIAGSAQAQSFIVGQPKTVSFGLPGCIDLRTENVIAGLLKQKEVNAAIKMAYDAGAKCRLFKRLEQVTVEGFSKPQSLSCIRPKDAQDCYWYPSVYLR